MSGAEVIGQGRPYRAVATHEAAHAVMTRLVGAPIERLVILNTVDGRTTYGKLPYPEGGGERERAAIGARMIAAGPLAEMILEGRPCTDFRRDPRALNSWKLDADLLSSALEQSGADVARIIADTETVLRRHWSAVEEVAAFLETIAEEDAPAEAVPDVEVLNRLVEAAVRRSRERGA